MTRVKAGQDTRLRFYMVLGAVLASAWRSRKSSTSAMLWSLSVLMWVALGITASSAPGMKWAVTPSFYDGWKAQQAIDAALVSSEGGGLARLPAGL